mmetsp:Transcript_2196/g.2539  ORF Transcript_2196/g.2539 Transcript_2196/m.2539 type:complete len:127 (-) Transcript_2196:215-595(-)
MVRIECDYKSLEPPVVSIGTVIQEPQPADVEQAQTQKQALVRRGTCRARGHAKEDKGKSRVHSKRHSKEHCAKGEALAESLQRLNGLTLHAAQYHMHILRLPAAQSKEANSCPKNARAGQTHTGGK